MSGSLPQSDIDTFFNDTKEHVIEPQFKKGSSIKKRYEKFREMQYDITDDQSEQIIGTVITIGSLITEHILCHPFIVLRRQCQVNLEAQIFHINPFTLVPPTVNIIKTQGVCSLWKGVTSCFVLSGLSLFSENVLSELTGYPRDVDFSKDPSGKIVRHLALKSMNFAILTPFYATNLIETIQSCIASDQPGLVDFFKESAQRVLRCVSQLIPNPLGFGRGSVMTIGSLQTPLLKLTGLTVAYGLTHYLLTRFLETLTLRAWVRARARTKKGDLKRGTADAYSLYEDDGDGFIKIAPTRNVSELEGSQSGILTANAVGRIGAEALTFPLESVLNRSRCCGSRLLIDDLDTGLKVTALPIVPEPLLLGSGTLPISTYYRGFGALVAQAAIQLALLRLTHGLLRSMIGVWVGDWRADNQPYPSPFPTSVHHPAKSFPGSPTTSEKDFGKFYAYEPIPLSSLIYPVSSDIPDFDIEAAEDRKKH